MVIIFLGFWAMSLSTIDKGEEKDNKDTGNTLFR